MDEEKLMSWARERDVELNRLRALEVLLTPERFAASVAAWARLLLGTTAGGREQLRRLDALRVIATTRTPLRHGSSCFALLAGGCDECRLLLAVRTLRTPLPTTTSTDGGRPR